MVRYTIYCQKFMIIILNNACDVLIQFGFPWWFDKRNPVLNGKNNLEMDLCVGISHTFDFCFEYPTQVSLP